MSLRYAGEHIEVDDRILSSISLRFASGVSSVLLFLIEKYTTMLMAAMVTILAQVWWLMMVPSADRSSDLLNLKYTFLNPISSFEVTASNLRWIVPA